MLFSTFRFGTRRFGIGHKNALDPKKTIDGVCIGMIVTGRIGYRYVFQRSNEGYQRKAYKISPNPNSAGQQTRRTLFADAVAWALALSPAEKDAYKLLVATP